MKKKAAIIHDWLNGMRGGEKVLEEILDILPEADIFTLFLEEEKISEKIKSHKIIASPLNKYKFIRKRYRNFLPFFPTAIESFNLEEYDLIISISHCAAKGIIPFPGSFHISYVNSPMRYIWDQYYSYFGHVKGLKKAFIKRTASKLRTWDVTSSARVDYFIGNSNFIKQRIEKYYRRDAGVIHPPVDTGFYCPGEDPQRTYFLTVSALVPYKGTELLVKTFNRTGDRLIVVGKGPEEKKLKKIAAANIEFKKDICAEELRQLYRDATAFVYGGIEDFGIVFVESLACGTPVVAFKKGGVLDIVKKGCGVLFEQRTESDLIAAIDKIKKTGFKTSFLRENSLQFSKENFKKKFNEMLAQKL
ncbi:MAG: glycosyltransferase [Candidatus Aminicenantes bacterium]|nr:glycosyltransferase [Candidatus Aminicenantes bacterium]